MKMATIWSETRKFGDYYLRLAIFEHGTPVFEKDASGNIISPGTVRTTYEAHIQTSPHEDRGFSDRIDETYVRGCATVEDAREKIEVKYRDLVALYGGKAPG